MKKIITISLIQLMFIGSIFAQEDVVTPPVAEDVSTVVVEDVAPPTTTVEDVVSPSEDVLTPTVGDVVSPTVEDVSVVAVETVVVPQEPVTQTPPPKAPETVGEAVQSVSLLVTLIKNKLWLPVVGMVLMLLVFLCDKVLPLRSWVGEKGVPWVAASLGVLTHVSAAFFTSVTWWEALVSGLGAGFVAVGLWETVVKAFKK